MYMQVVGKELFGLPREKHGNGFQSFIEDKVVPLAGDVRCKDFGVDDETLRELRLIEELDVIVNAAATTNFYERCASFHCIDVLYTLSKKKSVEKSSIIYNIYL